MNKIKYLVIGLGLAANTAMALSAEEQSALTTHNQLRKLHAAPALSWDATLARYARHHAANCQFKHSHGGYGENLAIGYPTAKAAITAWYSENTAYDYANGHFSAKTGHFTQLVWKSTTKVGCAIVDCDGLGNYLVCEYSPHGNVTNKGYFEDNVSKEVGKIHGLG